MLLSRYFLLCMLLKICSVHFSLAHADSQPYQALADVVFHPERSAPATALSRNNTTLSSQLNAVVKKVGVQVSQYVKRGDLLVELDCTDFELAQEMASARLESAAASALLAKSQLERARELLNKKLTSQQDYDGREAELRSSEALVRQRRAEVRQAEVQLSRCKVYAPFSGIVTERLVSLGQLAAEGAPLLTIVDTDNLELSSTISSLDYRHLNEEVAFVFDHGELFRAELYNSGGVINSQTRNIEVRFLFPDKKPMPGAAGRLRWQDPRKFVPADLIVKRENQLGIFILDKDSRLVEFIKLEQAIAGRPAPVDLPLSALVLTENLSAINHGDQLD